VAGRTVYGQPAVGGLVNTKYNGNYNVGGGGEPYGGYTKAARGPTAARSRRRCHPATHAVVLRPPYYTTRRPTAVLTITASPLLPGSCPYYGYYPQPPVGAILIMVAGVS